MSLGDKLPSNNLRLTIVGPHFFSYCDAIVTHIESLGIPAQSVDERGSQLFWIKAIFRSSLLRKLLPMVVRAQHDVIERKTINFKSTHVVFISPESINVSLIQSLKKSGVKVILYMWDSFDNKPAARDCLQFFDRSGTFDPIDAETHKLTMINLFAEQEFFVKESSLLPRDIDISFVGTAHSSRPKIITRFLTNPRFSTLNKKIHLYRGNAYYYLRALIMTSFSRHTPLLKESIPKQIVAQIFINSKYVLDITHNNQRGLTSRTFEALAAGSTLVTNNPWAQKLLPQFKESIIFFEDINSLILTNTESPEAKSNDASRSYLTLNRFCKEIVELTKS